MNPVIALLKPRCKLVGGLMLHAFSTHDWSKLSGRDADVSVARHDQAIVQVRARPGHGEQSAANCRDLYSA